MPIKVTVHRMKHLIKSAILSSVFCLVPVLILLICQIFDNGTLNLYYQYFYFSLAVLGTNLFLELYFGLLARKNKTLYILSTVISFVAIIVLAALGYLLRNDTHVLLVQIAWASGFLFFFYFIGEALNNSAIHARIWGPLIPLAIGALYFMLIYNRAWGSFEAMIKSKTIWGTIALVISGVMMTICFIMVFAKKKALNELASTKLAYDRSTSDEDQLDSRKDGDHLNTIPRIYEGNVYALDEDCIYGLVDSLNRYRNEYVEALNAMLDYANTFISTKEDWDSFKSSYDSYVDSLNKDVERLSDFIKEIAAWRFLDIDDGKKISIIFSKYRADFEEVNDNSTFYVYFVGFSYDVSYRFGNGGGKFSRTANFDTPNPRVINIGYHRAEVDHEANEHGYHLPGTPMPEED